MSEVAVVSGAWTAWEAREMDRVDEFFDPAVVFDFSHYEPWPHQRLYTGTTEAMQALGEWMLWWHAYWQDLIGYEESPGCVLAMVRHGGDRGGTHVEEHIALLFYVRGDRIVRWEPWADCDAARAALRA